MEFLTKESKNKISQIILDTWDLNNLDEYLTSGDKLINFNLYVSFIMCYGFNLDEIREYMSIYKIELDPEDCDLEDPNDHFGALMLSEEIVRTIREDV